MFCFPYSEVIIVVIRVGNTCGEDDSFGSPLSSYAVAIFNLFFFAVLAALLKLESVGAPESPLDLIVSPDPRAIRLRLAWMFA